MFGIADEILARRAAKGHIESFEELLARYRVRVYRFCYRLTGNAEDAEDWTQECFVRAYQNLHKYDPSRPFAPWFMQVVSNSCINLGKARSRRDRHAQDGFDTADERADPFADPMKTTLAKAQSQEIEDALEGLSPILRHTLVLWAQEDLTFKELAEILNVPLATASARVQRALQNLRGRLASEREQAIP